MPKTLVLARPGPFRRELLAFLRAIPELELVGVLEDPAALLTAVGRTAPHCLILEGGPVQAEVLAALAQLKRAALCPPCLVLVESHQQIQPAFAAGADGVLLKGFSTQEFLSALQALKV